MNPITKSRKNTARVAMMAAALTVTATPQLRGDEGMWTFDNLPVKLLKEHRLLEETTAIDRHIQAVSGECDVALAELLGDIADGDANSTLVTTTGTQRRCHPVRKFSPR